MGILPLLVVTLCSCLYCLTTVDGSVGVSLLTAGDTRVRFGLAPQWAQDGDCGMSRGILRLRGGAEKGKGDPRWIVTDREDGKNVGAWHWEEKDMFAWSKAHLIDSIQGTKGNVDGFEGEFIGHYVARNISRIAGDAVIHQRKGKLWPLCDLELHVQVKVRRRLSYLVIHNVLHSLVSA